MPRLFLFLLIIFTAGCGNPAVVHYRPEVAGIGSERDILVVTDRARSADGFLDGHRSEKLRYLNVSVSVPPEREPGSLNFGPRAANPKTDFMLTAETALGERAQFRQALRQRLSALPRSQREVVIFVHGYNTSFGWSVVRLAQLSEDFQLPGVSIAYSWPSAAHPLGYTHDRDSALFSRDGLESLLRDVFASNAENVLLVGHSMGGLLVMETVRQMDLVDPGLLQRELDGLVLISPDIDINLFRAQARRITALPQPFAILVSQRDPALRLSSRVNGRSERLGIVSNLEELGDIPVTVVDMTAFSGTARDNHFAIGTSSALISLLSKGAALNRSFAQGQSDPLAGTVITVRKATRMILSPGLVTY
ncbi:alpha/beta hydrolase [Pseudooceanicola sp. C21-150M6]|uniref:alpha/beta hydrolase n=1 Tax=Pseudooceanicola sp. C21-150M6 TaxID=3434355 RepID=UPI003D7FE518